MIAFDAATNGGSGTGTSLTYAHTCSGSQRILRVGVNLYNPGTDDLTGVTYAGVAMTQIGKVSNASGSGQITYMYELVNPASGSNNIIISKNNAIATIRSNAASYTGARQSGQPDAVGTNTANASINVAKSVATIADNSWMVSFTFNDGAQCLADTGTTNRNSDGVFMAIGDSGGPITPAGAYSMGWRIGAGTANWTIINASIAPDVPEGAFMYFAQ